jgi:heat shock protein HslJ
MLNSIALSLVVAVVAHAFSVTSTFAQAQVPVQIPVTPSAGGDAPAAPITQGVWLWQRTEYGDDTVLTASNPASYNFQLRAGNVLIVQADCNRASGTYTLSGSQLTFHLGPTTLVACPPGSQGDVFLRDLGQVATYVFDGQQLVLNMRFDSGNMYFSPLPESSLSQSPWRVQSYNNGRGGVVTVLAGTQLTATFTDDGQINGDAGCNTYNGPYTTAGSTIDIGPLATTRRACASDAENAQEQAFLAALDAASRYELAGDRLTLRDAGGATQAIMVRPTIQPAP